MRAHLVNEHGFLPRIYRFDRRQNLRLITGSATRALERLHVLRETGAAVAHTGIYESVADARVRTDADTYLLNVGPKPFGDIGHLVHEGNLGREHRVRRVFG